MATIEKRCGSYRLVFWYESKRYQGAVKAASQSDAAGLKASVVRNLQLLEEARLEYRNGDDLFRLMISDGKYPKNLQPATPKTFKSNTSFASWGGHPPIPDLTSKSLQQYIKHRLGSRTLKLS